MPEIQRWIKEMGKDIAKTEVEATLKRLSVSYKRNDSLL